jgi:hypothetical protein
MRTLLLIVGFLALIAGVVWIGQGAGWIAGSFMTGSRLWLIIGLVVAVIGIALVISGARRPARR